MCEVPPLDILVGESPEDSILEIIANIRPNWDTGNVSIKELAGGLVNRLYRCGLPEDIEENDVILIRVFGPGTDTYIDRERELLTMRLVHHAGFGAKVYCSFQNGLAYKFHRGKCVTNEESLEEDFARLAAKTLATLHLVDFKDALRGMGESDKTDHFDTIRTSTLYMTDLLSKLRDYTYDPAKDEIVRLEFPSKTEALSDIQQLEKELDGMHFPRSLCHFDPNPSNFVMDSHSGTVHLIDWEFSGVGYAPHDIGAYFGGKCGPDAIANESLSMYADMKYQRKWIRWYLEYNAKMSGGAAAKVTEEEVTRMYRGSILYGLMFARIVSFFFLMQDSVNPSHPLGFRLARHFQRLYQIIKEQHYLPMQEKYTEEVPSKM